MKKIIMVGGAIIIGLLFSKLIFNQYKTSPVDMVVKKIYFIQQGVYSSYESMQKNTSKLKKYTYEKIGDKYYVYGCFTRNKDNIKIIQKYFKTLGYEIFAKELNIQSEEFANLIDQYDYLLNAVTKEETIKSICAEVTKKYEEMVLNE